jgi:hypothetical protein
MGISASDCRTLLELQVIESVCRVIVLLRARGGGIGV